VITAQLLIHATWFSFYCRHKKDKYPYRFRLSAILFSFRKTVIYIRAVYVPKIYYTKLIDPTLHYMPPASQFFKAGLLIRLMYEIETYKYLVTYSGIILILSFQYIIVHKICWVIQVYGIDKTKSISLQSKLKRIKIHNKERKT
jgi:hypothetical protein